jgi:hypothetical protein
MLMHNLNYDRKHPLYTSTPHRFRCRLFAYVSKQSPPQVNIECNSVYSYMYAVKHEQLIHPLVDSTPFPWIAGGQSPLSVEDALQFQGDVHYHDMDASR